MVELAGVIAVLRRLMKAVFFFRDESRDLLTEKRSSLSINTAFVVPL